MFARTGVFSSIGRAGAVATVVAVALTAVQPSMAFAGSATSTSGKGAMVWTGTSDATDISARRRHYHGGGAAAAAAFAGIVGTGLAIAASRNAYDYYDGPVYGGPAYYAAPTYYGPGAYGYYREGDYPYQIYGGDSPYTVCAQATTWNCR